MPTSCKCFARCEADCVCDYDWTPPEVTRLRHDIERHIAMASELATENERLRAELAKLDGQINRCVEQNKYLDSTISRLREYAGHEDECAAITGWTSDVLPCDCGYDALMADLEYK